MRSCQFRISLVIVLFIFETNINLILQQRKKPRARSNYNFFFFLHFCILEIFTKKKMELETWIIVVIAVGGALLLGILIAVCCCCCKKKKVAKSTSQETLAKNQTLSPRNSQVILESGNDDFNPKVKILYFFLKICYRFS